MRQEAARSRPRCAETGTAGITPSAVTNHLKTPSRQQEVSIYQCHVFLEMYNETGNCYPIEFVRILML
jgi:hypothetical protein